MSTSTPAPKISKSAKGTGATVIEDTVIAKVASLAVVEVPGVYALGSGFQRIVSAVRGAFGDEDHGQGVVVEVGETQVAVDVSVVAEYPVALQNVADDVRTAVYTTIQELIGMEVTEVNVTITDVRTEDEDRVANEDQTSRVQ